MNQDHAHEDTDMDIESARELVRDAIYHYNELRDIYHGLQVEILGGLPEDDLDYIRMRLEKFKGVLATSGPPPPPPPDGDTMDDCISDAAICTEEQIANDTWVDEQISRIQQAHAGIRIDLGDRIIEYQPPV